MRFSLFRPRQSAGSIEQALEELRTASFFAPTPWAVCRQMLELAEIKPDDLLYDLGSGDGRLPIMAAQEFGCRAVGIELDGKLCRHAQEKVREYGLEQRVVFRQEDFFKAEMRDATAVVLYLLTQVNGHLGPRMASQLSPGTRVVSLDYPIPGWKQEKEIAVKSEGDVEYTLYLYRR
jgi:SAM-dependent methyltransferase